MGDGADHAPPVFENGSWNTNRRPYLPEFLCAPRLPRTYESERQIDVFSAKPNRDSTGDYSPGTPEPDPFDRSGEIRPSRHRAPHAGRSLAARPTHSGRFHHFRESRANSDRHRRRFETRLTIRYCYYRPQRFSRPPLAPCSRRLYGSPRCTNPRILPGLWHSGPMDYHPSNRRR